MTCVHSRRDCSALPFSTMPRIERINSETFVRCTEHAAKSAKRAQPEALKTPDGAEATDSDKQD